MSKRRTSSPAQEKRRDEERGEYLTEKMLERWPVWITVSRPKSSAGVEDVDDGGAESAPIFQMHILRRLGQSRKEWEEEMSGGRTLYRRFQ